MIKYFYITLILGVIISSILSFIFYQGRVYERSKWEKEVQRITSKLNAERYDLELKLNDVLAESKANEEIIKHENIKLHKRLESLLEKDPGNTSHICNNSIATNILLLEASGYREGTPENRSFSIEDLGKPSTFSKRDINERLLDCELNYREKLMQHNALVESTKLLMEVCSDAAY